MAASLVLAAFGVVLAIFGLFGVRSAEEIVEKQRHEDMSPVAADAIDDRTRIRVTRAMAAGFVVVGIGLLAYGLDVV